MALFPRQAFWHGWGMPLIDRCVCTDRTFSELVGIARRDGLDLRGLAERVGCGTRCGWCVAYLRRALRTGETRFSELLPKEPLDEERS